MSKIQKKAPPKDELKPKHGGSTMPTKDNLYARVANHLPEAIDKAVRLMHSNNENIALGAIKVLLDRGLPALKSLEISGPNGEPVQLKYIVDLAGGYIPPLGSFTATPTGGNTGSTQVQGTGMAQTSSEDNNSTDGAS